MFMNFNIQNGALAGVYVIFFRTGEWQLALCGYVCNFFFLLEPTVSRYHTN